ncbi:MAG: hypothetical protein HW416_2068, partial [Chloroflexi bacterium]|nr:hypothetical protein [Chloroflexota bacterium]
SYPLRDLPEFRIWPRQFVSTDPPGWFPAHPYGRPRTGEPVVILTIVLPYGWLTRVFVVCLGQDALSVMKSS